MPHDLVSNLMLHPLYLVPWLHGEWMNPVFWTLAIEFQYYLAILMLGQPLLSDTTILKRTILVVVFVLSFATTDTRLLFVYLPLFAFGFIYFLYQTKRIIPIEAASWGAAFILPAWTHLGLQSVAAASITVALFQVTVLERFTPLLWLGSISYSLYLVHVPIGGRIINFANRYSLTLTTQILAVVIACSASLAAAFILWRLVEVPSQRASQKYRFLTKARPQPPATSQSVGGRVATITSAELSKCK
jgi:peptidoglycan/LPS O-acetylase OafA/YrhL